MSSTKGIKRITYSLIMALLISMFGVNIAIAHGTVDLSYPLTTADAGLTGKSIYVVGQSFTPQADNIVSFDLYFGQLNGHPIERTVSVSIHEFSGTPELPNYDGAIIGTVTQTITVSAAFYETEPVHFDFSSPIPLVPGDTYIIEAKIIGVDSEKHGLVYGASRDVYEGTVLSGYAGSPPAPNRRYDLGLTTYSGASSSGDILKSSGVPGKGLDDAPGLQKEFNENSQAAENAGKK